MTTDIRSQLLSPNPDAVGRASADFAQKLWNGEVDDCVLLDLLNDTAPRVRAEVAWAIADAHRPKAGVDWLLSKGLCDPYEGVRFWATQLLLEWNEDALQTRIDQIRKMLEDPAHDVLRNVHVLIDRWRRHSKADGQGSGKAAMGK
jgi:hypothetical protein